MQTLEVREELVDAIKEQGKDVAQFANTAIEEALKPRRTHVLNASGDCCCFADDHCANNS
jgi:hypothetical protein